MRPCVPIAALDFPPTLNTGDRLSLLGCPPRSRITPPAMKTRNTPGAGRPAGETTSDRAQDATPLGLAPSKREQLGPKEGELWLCALRSEEHTSEIQSLAYLVCRL